MNKTHNGFRRAAQGVFPCAICGRGTRETGEQGGTGLCPHCFNICGLDNMINDEGLDATAAAPYRREAEAQLKLIVKRGGDAERVKANNSFVWPKA